MGRIVAHIGPPDPWDADGKPRVVRRGDGRGIRFEPLPPPDDAPLSEWWTEWEDGIDMLYEMGWRPLL